MKLYDRVDEETEQKERNEPLCILLVVAMFMIIFLGLIMLNFNRSTAHFLERQAEDLETKVAYYEKVLDRLDTQTSTNQKVFIPALIKKRYLVHCSTFNGKVAKESDMKEGKASIKVDKDFFIDGVDVNQIRGSMKELLVQAEQLRGHL